MNGWPEFNEHGDLPTGVHVATVAAVLAHFAGTARRQTVARRLVRIYEHARSTNCLARFIIFGSFITAKPDPNDVDIFLLMEDSFDVRKVFGEARLIFDHGIAQNLLGASVFWVRRSAAIGGSQAMIEHWQIKRDGDKRGIVEIVEHD